MLMSIYWYLFSRFFKYSHLIRNSFLLFNASASRNILYTLSIILLKTKLSTCVCVFFFFFNLHSWVLNKMLLCDIDICLDRLGLVAHVPLSHLSDSRHTHTQHTHTSTWRDTLHSWKLLTTRRMRNAGLAPKPSACELSCVLSFSVLSCPLPFPSFLLSYPCGGYINFVMVSVYHIP